MKSTTSMQFPLQNQSRIDFKPHLFIIKKKNNSNELLQNFLKFLDCHMKKFKLITQKNSFITELVINLKGGGKKRKKKNYTKPKKVKHVRKKIKLKTMVYYCVKNGKIEKLRKESPMAKGRFMAEHSDRLTCGKTGLTLIRST